MAVKYEQIPTEKLAYAKCLKPTRMPEILHLDDDAKDGMYDFEQLKPATVFEEDTLTDAMEVLQSTGQHLLLVTDISRHVIGILRSEDIQGQKPYQIMQEKSIQRGSIPVKLLMKPYDAVLTFDDEQLKGMKIGNVVVTMQAHKKHYAIVQKKSGSDDVVIQGSFSISHLNHALGSDVSLGLSEAQSIMELQRKVSK